jgi:hypothetical protein
MFVAQDPQRGVINTTYSRTYPYLYECCGKPNADLGKDPLFWVLLRVMWRWAIKTDEGNAKARSAMQKTGEGNPNAEWFDKSSAWR